MYSTVSDFRKKGFYDGEIVHYLLILATCFFSFFLNNDVIPADLMESRNLATAQEMVREGNYLLPTMNGEPRLEKPPLPTWIAAGIEYISPDNLVLQRYASGIMATFMMIFLYLLTIRLTRNRTVGLIAALVLATSFGIILMGRTASWDIYCHSFMLAAIYMLVCALEGRGKQWTRFILSGIFMGLSFLSKGPVSFYALLLPFLIGYIPLYRPSAREKLTPLFTLIVVCLAVSFWWMLYVHLHQKEVLSYVVEKESASWINRNIRPWYYYWQFPTEFGIWALFLVTAILSFFFCEKERSRHESGFALLWMFASLVLLSLIPEKKIRYLLPVLIPGALVTALYIHHTIKDILSRTEKGIFRLNALVLVLVLVALPVASWYLFYRGGKISLLLLIAEALISWGLASFILISSFRWRTPIAGNVFVAAILTMVLVTGLCLDSIGSFFINEEANSIHSLRNNRELKELPFYHNQEEEIRMELVYGANRTIRPLDLSNDSLVYTLLPFVLISGKPVDSLFRDKPVVIEPVTITDDNWRKRGSKRYNPNLVREVAIIRPE